MTIEENIKAQCEQHGLTIISLEDSDLKGDRLEFTGSAAEFANVVAKLKLSPVFSQTFSLSEALFLMDDPVDEENDAIDLTSVETKLSRFKSYINETGAIELFVYGNGWTLHLNVAEEWWKEFAELRSQAEDLIQERAQQQATEAEEHELQERTAAEQKRATLLQQMDSLMNDPVFTKLKTQRAMRTYALEQIPELATLRDAIVKEKIATLADRIGLKTH